MKPQIITMRCQLKNWDINKAKLWHKKMKWNKAKGIEQLKIQVEKLNRENINHPI